MPVMVVTRLRLKDGALLDEFFTDAFVRSEPHLRISTRLDHRVRGDVAHPGAPFLRFPLD